MIICVTGAVGTGKTVISKSLAKKLNFVYLDVNDFIKKNKLKERYIKKLDTYEVDITKLNKKLIEYIKKSRKSLIIDSHLSHYLPSKYVDFCVVCKVDLKVLKDRLKKRKYSLVKIRENLDAEIFDVCLIEALEKKHHILVVDTTHKTVSACVDEILHRIK